MELPRIHTNNFKINKLIPERSFHEAVINLVDQINPNLLI